MNITYLDFHMPYHFVEVDGVAIGYLPSQDELINEHDEPINDDDLKHDIIEFLQNMESICGHCSGSGEGMHDGTRCFICRGSGVINEGVI